MFRVTGLCAGNSSVAGEFPAQGASNTENDSIWWRHHDMTSDLHVQAEPITCQFYSLMDADIFLSLN